jgi:serine protease Do
MAARRVWRTAPLLLAAGIASKAVATSPSPTVQQNVRNVTFEVVVRRTTPDPLTYERPLPLELLPFSIRTDSYWPIGTAFAIGPNRFVTAGHVLAATVGSQYGTPALRDPRGHVYSLDQILAFSLDRDFAVFAVRDAPTLWPLATNPSHRLDEVVLAVGNALGEGIVIRDGLLTSETPEEQEGRWKWLRYSAAASPGSSGGPLLNISGEVIGVITAKSANENLNYALPIPVVLDSKPSATFDTRQAFRVPILHDAAVLQITDHFDLPKSFSAFSAAFQDAIDRADTEEIRKILDLHKDELFPQGDCAKALASTYSSLLPTLLFQGEDKSWQAPEPDAVTNTDLPEGGRVSIGTTNQIQFFHVVRPNRSSSDDFYDDPKAFSDLLLKGMRITRSVATEAVRVTSLGPVLTNEVYKDRYGRVWQIRAWWLGDLGGYLLTFCLPTPDGYSGFGEIVPGVVLRRIIGLGKLATDYTLASYSGSPDQWIHFLARQNLRPASFDNIHIAFESAKGLRYESERLALDLPRTVVAPTDRSALELVMGFADHAGAPQWDVAGIIFTEDIDRQTNIEILRQPKPTAGAGQDLMRRWQQLAQRKSPYDNVAQRLAAPEGYAIATSISMPWSGGVGIDPNADVLYEVRFQLETAALPRELEARQRGILQGLRILER